MLQFIAHPLKDTPDALMQKAGYVRHCVETGRACYHRSINDVPFPRFHVYVAITQRGMEIDLHFDALDIQHKGNHSEPWAYEGGRVNGEMGRIMDAIRDEACLGKINQPFGAGLCCQETPPPKKKSLFDILFRNM